MREHLDEDIGEEKKLTLLFIYILRFGYRAVYLCQRIGLGISDGDGRLLRDRREDPYFCPKSTENPWKSVFLKDYW